MASPHGSKWIRKRSRWAIYLRDGYRCLYCDLDLLTADAVATLDHLTPKSRSKTPYNGPNNLVTACYECNTLRGAQNWRHFIEASAAPADVEAIVKRITRHRRRKIHRYRELAARVLDDSDPLTLIDALED